MIITMVTNLFANFCILATFVFLSGMISKKLSLTDRPPSLLTGINAGLLFGVFGIILMNYSFQVVPDIYVNLRHLTLVIVSAYVGWFPSLVCAAVLAVSRILFNGVSINTVSTAVTLLLGGLCCSFISTFPWSRLKKMTVGNIACMTLTFIILLLNLGSLRALMDFYPTQLLISLGAGLVIYYIAESIQHSNELFALLEVRATTDYLTGLHNLQQFHRHMDNEIIWSERHQECLSLLAIDIDHFKIINDTYGHPAGDEVLKQLAWRLKSHSHSHDMVSRNGGEEFTVLMPHCSLSQAETSGEKLRRAVEMEPFLLPSGQKIPITVSIGVACYPETVAEADGKLLTHWADQALYDAKNTGRNKVSINSNYSAAAYSMKPAT
ncbi:diguanylate cyclase [Paenibacillus wynnii]|uniref:diguanylate cyclase n=1 Tax=Paenibacillus wynnii TaxID=268407 RepID=UPI00278D25A8|nr:diguanylate cyclase [Paenibacillus wynnii]MDQ0192280.1 diguanylate cyclase [Paenibacillus wynnii]